MNTTFRIEEVTNRIPVITETGNDGHIRPESAPKAHRRRRNLLALAGLIVAGVIAVVYYVRFIAPFESTDDAFIEGRITPMAPQVAGRVVHLLVRDNQEVKRGETLLEIAPEDYQSRLDEALANLATTSSRLDQAKAQFAVDQAKANQERANVNSAAAEANRAEADLKRYRAVESRAVSRSQIDLAEAQARSAAAQLEVARDKALAAEAQVKLSQTAIQTASAQIQQSEAAVAQARLNLSYTKLTAPEDGRVTKRSVEQGAYLQPGQAVMAIVPDELWVIANFKETQLTHMHPGQPVEIKVDAYPGRKLKGHVDSFQKGAGARFSMFPPENATGNYVKVVQRVPVKIVFDEVPDGRLALGPGMSVEPEVRVK